MKNIKSKFFASAKDEKGIALLFTLGILAVLLVIALGFATTSITERKAAGNNNDLAVARMLAESAVNKAMIAVKLYSDNGNSFFANIQTQSYDNKPLNTADNNNDTPDEPTDDYKANRETFDGLWKIATPISGITIYPWPSSYDKTKNVNWQYIDNGLTPGDPNYRLIGRIAYTVIDSGNIDPSATVSHGASALLANENGDNVDRKGIDVNEISIKNLDESNAGGYLALPHVVLNPTNLVSLMSSTSATPTAGLLQDGTRWNDWETMYSILGLTEASDPGGLQRNQFRKWFVLNKPMDPEAFWVDTDGDGKAKASEMFNRFNLARTDWGAIAALGGNAAVAKLMEAPTLYSSSATPNDGTGIKWLKNNTSLPAETFTSAAIRAKQIAANLIDYCDTNDDVTSDNVTDWATTTGTAPTYTGNEKTPYINEIKCNYEVTMVVTEPSSGVYHLDSTEHKIYISLEIINLYGLAGTATAYISGEWEFERRRTDGSELTGSGTFTNKLVTVTFLAGDTYKMALDVEAGTYSSGIPPNGVIKPKINYAKVRLTKASLKFNAKNADYSKFDNTWQSLPDVVVSTGAGSFSADAYYSWQTEDPRNNLNAADWNFTSMVAADYTAAGGTPGAQNKKAGVLLTCNSGDNEGCAPEAVSTNFIRNAPMQSPWELGFIHRGAKWETLNIHTYNTSAGVSNTGGIGTYANGDANILDQVKMTSATQVYGKVNVQAASVDVLKALLGYIRVGVALPNNGTDGTAGNSDDSNPGLRSGTGSGTLLDYSSDVTNIATAINTGTGVKPYQTRAQLAKVTNLFGLNGSSASGINQNTKAKKDEIIGKIVNLVKAGASDTVTVIAIAQSIRDVGAPAGITISKDLNQNGTIDITPMNVDSNAKTAVGYCDNNNVDIAPIIPAFYETKTDCKLGQYDIGMDEILAEQKIMATLCRDAVSGKWKILRYEYLEE